MVKHARTYLLTAVIAGAFLTAIMSAGWFRHWRESLIDVLYTAKSAPTNAIIVEIDEQTIKDIGHWPLPRSTYGNLIDRISRAQAAVIGIDINFKEPSANPAEDIEFAETILRSQVPVVLTAEVQPDNSIIHPVIPLTANNHEGFPNIFTSSDGVVRATRLTISSFPSFATIIAQQYHARQNRPAYLPPDDAVRIAYSGPNRTYPFVSAIDVLNDKIPNSFFVNRIVLIGATAKDLQDYHKTPFGLMSGVEIQTSIATTLVEGDYYRQLNGLSIALTFLFALVIGISAIFVPHLLIIVGIAIMSVVIYTVAVFLAFDSRYILDLLYPNFSFFLASTMVLTAQYRTATNEKKFIQDTFSRYLAPQVIAELMRDPSQLKLGGQKRELSILFSDIRSFTSISEAMRPERLTKFLNDYLTTMTDIILKHQGVVDKYIGDAIMTFWGAPLENTRHAQSAVSTAAAMIDALDDFNARHALNGDPPINIGIGINTGEVTVGNMGSEKRFDYTVLGDSVNLASRLEGLTKTYGVNIIIGEVSFKKLGQNKLLIRELDRVQVKGKKNAVSIYEIVPQHFRKQVEQILKLYAEGRELYYRGRWNEAIIKFEQILIVNPQDGPTKLLRERCLLFKKRPPEEWEGVFEHTHK